MQNQDISQPSAGKKLLKKFPLIAIAGLVAGAVGGYIYYSTVGCVSGTCAITSNPWMSTIWGGAIGYLVFDTFNFRKKKSQDQ
jgi:hypothetical protein